MKKLLLLCLLLPLGLRTSAQTPQPGLLNAGATKPEALKAVSSGAATVQQQAAAQNRATAGGEVEVNVAYPDYWPDRIFVKMKEQEGAQLQTYETKKARLKNATGRVNTTLRRFETSSVTELPRSAKLASFKNTYEVVVDKPEQLQQLLSELNAMPEVAYAERVPLYYTTAPPNDPMYAAGQQYAMNKINAVGAADILRGTAKTVLAIVDDAVLIAHPDLQANTDAAKSYDVADRDTNPNPPVAGTNKATANSFSHGTHCAGIAGAVSGNGVGIAAVSNNRISIIGIKCTSDYTNNSRLIERSTEGMLHAINQGARVVSMSYGGYGFSQTIQGIINEATANGVVFVAAAGNDNSETIFYPAGYANVISVASSDASDLKSSFSNYGTWVDITAPGSNILSTVANGSAGEYISYNGTSMATPMVAGLVALMLSENPNLTAQAVAELLKTSADPIDNVSGQAATLAGKLGAGRINALKAIQAIQALRPAGVPAAIADLRINRTSTTEVDLAWTAPAVEGTVATVLYDIRYATTPITAANFNAATRTIKSITPGTPGTAQALTVGGLAPGTSYYFAIIARTYFGDGSPLSNVANSTTGAAPHIAVNEGTGTTFTINRTSNSTATGSFVIANTGSEPLAYNLNLHPKAGANLLNHDKLQSSADNRFGYGSANFITAVKFVAGPRGFNLSHVQNYIYNGAAVNGATVGVRILKGGTTPANATQVATQSFTANIPAGGEVLTFKLQQALQLQPGEVFWVAFVLPAGMTSPQGIDTNMGAKPGVFYISSDGGTTYNDAQPLATFLNTAAFKIRAVDASWIALSAASGTIPVGQSREVAISVNADNIVNGTYLADIRFGSNAPLTPVVNRPITVNVTGGQGTLVVENTAVNFGALHVGTSGTGKVLIKNTGVAALTINSATFSSGNFPATDFTLSPALPFSIQPGTQQELNVAFIPSRKEALAGTVTLASDGAPAPSAVINLAATLISPPFAVVTADNRDVVLNKIITTSASRTVRIQNAGEAALSYAVHVLADPASTLSYDADRNADSYLGYNSTTTPFHAAAKFNVTTPRYTLAQVQSYYRSMSATAKDVTVKIIKGGTKPSEGTLLLQQTVNDAASANNGGLVTVFLKEQQQFVQGDVFWVVFAHTGVTYPQGINTVAPPENTFYYSADGNTWSAWSASSFKIRALGAPAWLHVAPASTGTVNAGAETAVALTLDAADLEVGTYAGRVAVLSNSSGVQQEIIQLNLQVLSQPEGNPTALSKSKEELEGVAVYPNPATERFVLEFAVQKPENLHIRMISLTGQVMLDESHRNFSGTYKQEVNSSRFAAGVYILQVQQGDKRFTCKLLIR